MRSLDQRRAAAAYREIAEADPRAIDSARRLPSMLQINGLLATWAFLLAKQTKQPTLLPALLRHLRSLPELGVPAEGSPSEAFLGWVGGGQGASTDVSTTALRELTAEALAFAGWLKRAAEASAEAEPAALEVSDASS